MTQDWTSHLGNLEMLVMHFEDVFLKPVKSSLQ